MTFFLAFGSPFLHVGVLFGMLELFLAYVHTFWNVGVLFSSRVCYLNPRRSFVVSGILFYIQKFFSHASVLFEKQTCFLEHESAF